MEDQVKHVKADDYKGSRPSTPFAMPGFKLTLPETIETKLVDASALSDYELWFFITSFLMNITVGAFFYFLGNQANITVGIFAGVFFLLTVLSFVLTLIKRAKLNRKTRTIAYPREQGEALRGDHIAESDKL